MKAKHIDTPDECPDCGRACANSISFISHYSQVHGPPYPWPDTTTRGQNWKYQRRRALERDGEQCQECGSEGFLHVHHVNEDRTDHRLANLRTLCADCHRSEHQRRKLVDDPGDGDSE